MSESRNTRPRGGEPSIGTLVGRLTDSLSRLIRDELQLLQAQIAEKGKAVGMGAGMFVGAALFGLFGLGWLLTGGMFALALVLPYWAAALIVAGAVLVIALILALVGKTMLQRGKTPDPKGNLKQDVDAIKQGVSK